MSDHKVPFNRPYMTGRELAYIAEAHSCGHLAGDGPFTRRSHAWLEQQTGCRKALLTPSCTAALEMMALLLDIEEGDEVILPLHLCLYRQRLRVARWCASLCRYSARHAQH